MLRANLVQIFLERANAVETLNTDNVQKFNRAAISEVDHLTFVYGGDEVVHEVVGFLNFKVVLSHILFCVFLGDLWVLLLLLV
jgi:hypothetical protein